MMFIDTHAHTYSNSFKGDAAAMLGRAREAGIGKILMPAIDRSTHQAMLDMEAANDFCHSMMGVHPCSIGEDFEEELKEAEDHLASRPFIAVGEIGLDFYWDVTYKEQQYKALHRQIEWALHYDLPICIHSRNATPECIAVVREHQQGKLRGVFHCFSGTAAEAAQLTDMGFYLGIGGVLTFKNGGLDTAIKDVDLAWLILETDAPYLAPVPFRGKRNEPAYVPYVAQKLADLRETSVENIATVTTANARTLFRLEA
ncbi:TatD family hydrolase [Nostoc ellipsosporum NOK]|nr:TatD family hydrolase [Nostoc ellipsosporum NOK]